MATAQKGGFRGGRLTGDDGNRDGSMAGVCCPWGRQERLVGWCKRWENWLENNKEETRVSGNGSSEGVCASLQPVGGVVEIGFNLAKAAV